MYDSFNPPVDPAKAEGSSRKSSQAGLETNSAGDGASVKTKTSFNDTATGTVISDMNGGASTHQLAVKEKKMSDEDKAAFLEVTFINETTVYSNERPKMFVQSIKSANFKLNSFFMERLINQNSYQPKQARYRGMAPLDIERNLRPMLII
jgi:hypothetical protein